MQVYIIYENVFENKMFSNTKFHYINYCMCYISKKLQNIINKILYILKAV